MTNPRWILAFGLSIGIAALLPNILGGWYLDADDWLILRMGREVAEGPQWRHFFGFWTEEPTWRPLLTARAGLESWLFGDALLPRLLVNLTLHLACALVLYRLALAWLGRPVAAAWAAVLFFVHPLHAEALAWFHSGFEGITVTLPILLCVLAFVRGRPTWQAMVLFQLALLVRENALAVPLLITALAWARAPRLGRWRATFHATAPFWALLVANVGARFVAVSLDPGRGAVGSFHVADAPLVALITTFAHPWLPVHPALPGRVVWWLVFASVPFGLAWTQRGVDRLPLRSAAVGFALSCVPFLPAFHDAERFLHAWPGGYEQRWYFFHLPLAALVLWPAYVVIARDRNKTRWSALALAALCGLFLTAQCLNARWWRDRGVEARAVLDVVDDGLAQRPRGVGVVVTAGRDASTLADEVFLNLPVTRPDVARRYLRVYHLYKDSPHAAPILQAVGWDRSGQVRWRDTANIVPDVLWWRFDAEDRAMVPMEPADLEVPVGALAPCCRPEDHAK